MISEAKDGSVYNVGGHNEQRNIDIVHLIIDIVRRQMEQHPEYRKFLPEDKRGDISWISYDLITYVSDRLGHDLRYAIDPSKIKHDIGWYPETTFAVGIEKTVEWNLQHRDWVDEVTSGDYQKYYEHMYGHRG